MKRKEAFSLIFTKTFTRAAISNFPIEFRIFNISAPILNQFCVEVKAVDMPLSVYPKVIKIPILSSLLSEVFLHCQTVTIYNWYALLYSICQNYIIHICVILKSGLGKWSLSGHLHEKCITYMSGMSIFHFL